MRHLRLSIVAASFLLIGTASAMESVTWDLTTSVPEGLIPQNLTAVQASDQGLYVQTNTDGFLQLPPPGIDADSLVITLTNIDSPEIGLIWNTPTLAQGDYYQYNIRLPAGQSQKVVAPMHQESDWLANPPMMGLAMPAGTEILIQRIEWRSYSAWEHLVNGIISFWTPDSFRLYSINFLWGPLVGTSPEARSQLYETLPPHSWSGMRVFYVVLVLAVIIAVAMRFFAEGGRRKMLPIIGLTFVTLWIIFDARMVVEVLSYVRDDWRTYITAEKGTRVLRSHETLYEFLEKTDAAIGDAERYVLITPEGTPIYANTRYRLYPAEPLRLSDPHEGVSTFVIAAEPSVRAVSGSLIAGDGTVLARDGSVIYQFDDASFVFRTNPQL